MLESGKKYPLYEIPRHSWIKVDDYLMLFNNIDGAYSICAHNGQVVHIAAWTEVEYIGEFEGFGDEDCCEDNE